MAANLNFDFRCGVAMLGVAPLNFPTSETRIMNDLKSRF